MKIKSHNILLVDDHPMIMDAHINLIKLEEKYDASIFHKALDCYSASNVIKQLAKSKIVLDLAFIDISVPKCEEEKLFSGVDLALMIRKIYSNCIIIFLTMHTQPLILINADRQVKPEGFLSKNDVTFENFSAILAEITRSKKFYSKSIKSLIQSFIRQTIKWDDFDTQILLLISNGINTKDLPQYIDLSLSSIEKRKALLKFEILHKKGSDKELIQKCIQLKLI